MLIVYAWLMCSDTLLQLNSLCNPTITKIATATAECDGAAEAATAETLVLRPSDRIKPRRAGSVRK